MYVSYLQVGNVHFINDIWVAELEMEWKYQHKESRKADNNDNNFAKLIDVQCYAIFETHLKG